MVGVDYGALSGRAVVVQSATGRGSAAPPPDRVQAFDTLLIKSIALREYFGRGATT